MIELNERIILDLLLEFSRRVEAIKMVGGVRLCDVVGGTATVPNGWVLDRQTDWFVPPGFTVPGGVH